MTVTGHPSGPSRSAGQKIVEEIRRHRGPALAVLSVLSVLAGLLALNPNVSAFLNNWPWLVFLWLVAALWVCGFLYLHFDDINASQAAGHAAELQRLRTAQAAEVNSIHADHREQLAQLRSAQTAEMGNLRANHREELAEVRSAHKEVVSGLADAQTRVTAERDALAADLQTLRNGWSPDRRLFGELESLFGPTTMFRYWLNDFHGGSWLVSTVQPLITFVDTYHYRRFMDPELEAAYDELWDKATALSSWLANKGFVHPNSGEKMAILPPRERGPRPASAIEYDNELREGQQRALNLNQAIWQIEQAASEKFPS